MTITASPSRRTRVRAPRASAAVAPAPDRTALFERDQADLLLFAVRQGVPADDMQTLIQGWPEAEGYANAAIITKTAAAAQIIDSKANWFRASGYTVNITRTGGHATRAEVSAPTR